jgi:hypothetical protein
MKNCLDLRKSGFRLCLGICILSGLSANAYGSDVDLGLVAEIKKAFEEYVGSVRTLSATIKVETKYNDKGSQKLRLRHSEWVQIGENYRSSEDFEAPSSPAHFPVRGKDVPTEVDRKETKIKSVVDGNMTQVEKRMEGGKVTYRGAVKGIWNPIDDDFMNIWTRAGFVVNSNPKITVLDILKNAKGTSEITEVKDSQDGSIKLTSRLQGQGRVVIVFGPKPQYRVREVVFSAWSDAAVSPIWEYAITSYFETKEKLRFPDKIVFRSYAQGKSGQVVTSTSLTTLSNLQINTPVNPSKLSVQIPSDYPIVDRTNQTVAVADATGKRMPPIPLEVLAPPVMSAYGWRTYVWVIAIAGAGILGLLFVLRGRRVKEMGNRKMA